MSRQKVAITTWFHHQNYGTALQALALTKKLETLGFESKIVNYIPPGTQYTAHTPTYFSTSERVTDNLRTKKYNDFLARNLQFTKKCTSDEDFNSLNKLYDVFITGSDQVWSPIVFDSRYYLDFVTDSRKKVSYASSFGVSDINNQMVCERTKNLISQFAHIAVREQSGADLVKTLTGRKAQQVLDPTLLLDYKEWRNLIPKPKVSRKKYILCYFLNDNRNQWLHVKKLAKQYNIPLKIIPIFSKDAEYGEFENGVGPDKFFDLIDGAELVLTDSYHGTIFSIICQKPFYVFERFRSDDPVSQNSRIYNLLESTRLNQQLIQYEEVPRNNYNIKIDFNKALKNIDRMRQESIEYIKNSLRIDEPKVTMILPAYNVETYIERCIESVIQQTYKNLEIIVVDDGSPDKSGDIADKYEMRDKRVRVIHKKNGGLSSARNAALEIATGEYVVFVDTDDVIAPTYVEYFLGLIENNNVNIAASINFYNEYSVEQNIIPARDYIELYEPEKVIEGIYAWFYPLPVWNKIYRRSFIEKNKLRFRTELLSAEGMTFNIMSLQKSGPVAVGRSQLYYQTFNPNSATRSTDIKRWETCFKAYKYQKKNSTIWNDRIDRAHRLHAWLCNSSVARQIYKAGEEKKYAWYLFKYIWRMRMGILSVYRANITKEQKELYINIAKNPKKYLNDINRDENNRIRSNNLLNPRTMPWNHPKTPLEPIIVEPMPTEIEMLTVEIDKLKYENTIMKNELISLMSIKRSARLVVGNIKRRILYGKKR